MVSELRKAKPGRAAAGVVAWAETAQASELFVSAITIQELEMGVLQIERRDAAQGAVLRAWLDQQVLPGFSGRILPVDTAVALRCARFQRVALRSRVRHMPQPRSFIG